MYKYIFTRVVVASHDPVSGIPTEIAQNGRTRYTEGFRIEAFGV